MIILAIRQGIFFAMLLSVLNSCIILPIKAKNNQRRILLLERLNENDNSCMSKMLRGRKASSS